MGVAYQSAHVRLAGDLHIHQLQIADGRALDDVEEAYVLPLRRVNGHMGDGVPLSVEHSRKGLTRAADAVKRRILQVQIGLQAVILAQCLGISGLRQCQQVVHRLDVHPADGGRRTGQFLPGRSLEAVLGGALEPQHLIAVLYCGQRCTDVGQRIVDGEHPAVRRVHRTTVDGVDETSEGAGGGIAVGQQALPLRLVHQIHQAGIAVAVHGDGDHVAHAVEGVAVLVVGGDGQLDGDLRRHRRLRHGNAQQIGQAAVLIRLPRPHAAVAAGDGRQEGVGLHLIQRLAHRAVSLSRRGGAVEVAVRDALGLVVLERGIGLVAADEAVALLTADGNDACGIAVLIGVAAVHRAARKAAGIASGVDITQREAVFDGTAVAQTHKAPGVLAGGVHRHTGPAAFDLAAGLVGAHKAGVTRSRQTVGGQRAALHIAAADDAVVAADHTAQHRAGVGGDIGVHHSALFHAAVVVMHQHRCVVGEQHVGAVNGQIVDIRRGAGVPEQAAVIVAEGQPGDRMPLSVELTHEGIGDPADGLGFGLLRRRQLGEVNIRRQTVVLAPRHLLLVGRTGTPGRLVLHVCQRDPLCRTGDILPLLGAGVLLVLVGVVHIAVRRGDAVCQTQLLQQALVADGRNGEGVLLPRRKGVGEVGGGIVPRQRKRLEVGVDRICTLARHRVEVNSIGAAEVLPAVPLGRRPLPVEAGHRRHAVVGLLIADDLVLRRLYVAAHWPAIFLLCHGGIVHAVAPCGKPSGQVILPGGNIGDILHEGQLGLIDAQILRPGQTDDKRRAALHGLIQTLARHVLRVVLRCLHSGVQLGKLRPLLLAHAADDRRCVHILQLLQTGEPGVLSGDGVILRQTVRIQRHPAPHHLPEGNGVGLARLRVPQQQAGRQGGHIAVVGVELLSGEADILRHGHDRGRRLVRLPRQHGIAVVDAANCLPVVRAQLVQQRGLHFAAAHGRGVFVDVRSGIQIVAVFQDVTAAGSDRAGCLAGHSTRVVAARNGPYCTAEVPSNTTSITGGRCNSADIVAIRYRCHSVIIANDSRCIVAVASVDNSSCIVAAGNSTADAVCANAAQNTASVLAGSHICLVAAILNGAGRGLGPGQDARGAAGAADSTLHHHIFDGRGFGHAEQSGVGHALHLQPADGVALAVEASGKLMGILADGRPRLVTQINVVRQLHIELCDAGGVVDGVRQPGQLRAAADLVGGGLRAASAGLFLLRAAPCGGGRQRDADRLILGHVQRFNNLGIALGLDGVAVRTLRQPVAAVALRLDGLAVPGHRDGGVGLRRGDGEGHRPLGGGGQGHVLRERLAADRHGVGLLHIAEGGDGVGVGAVRQLEHPLAAGMGAGLAVDGHHGVGRGDGEGHGVGGDLPAQDGVAVVQVLGRSHEGVAQGGGQGLQLVRGLGGGIGVSCQATEIKAVLHCAGGLVSHHSAGVVAIGNLCHTSGVAVLHSSVAAVEIGGDTTGAIAAGGAISAVIAAIDRYLTVNVTDNAAGVIAVGADGPSINAAGDGLRCRAVSAGHIAYDAAHVLTACYRHITAAVTDTALRTAELTDNAACTVAAAATSGKGDGPLHGQILDGTFLHIAKQAAVL